MSDPRELRGQIDELHIVDDHPATPRWRWRVSGREEARSTLPCSYEAIGRVQAELAAEVLIWLADHGPVWGVLDTGAEFTITITPDQPAAPEQQAAAVVHYSPQCAELHRHAPDCVDPACNCACHEEPEPRLVLPGEDGHTPASPPGAVITVSDNEAALTAQTRED